MRALMGKVRTRVGYAAVGALLTLAAGGVATAAVISPATDEVSTVTTEPTVEAVPEQTVAEPTEAPAVTTEAPAPTDTVEDVTEPEPQPTPIPADQDMSGIGTTGPDGNYTPAPPVQRQGEPPIDPDTWGAVPEGGTEPPPPPVVLGP